MPTMTPRAGRAALSDEAGREQCALDPAEADGEEVRPQRDHEELLRHLHCPRAAPPDVACRGDNGGVPTYRDEVVVLRTHKLGEADRIVTMLSRRHGKLRAVAKGVRRTSSKFGARLEPFMVADVQLYQGRSLDIVQQAESLGSYGAAIVADYDRYTAAHDGRDRRPAERAEATPQQYLLLVGGCALCPSNARGPLRARLVPPARDGAVRLGPLARGLRPLRRTRTARRVRRAARRVVCGVRAGRLGAHPPRDRALLRAHRGEWESVDAAPDAATAAASGLVAAYASGIWSAASAPCPTWRTCVEPKPYTHRDAVPYRPLDWTGVHPPAFPKGACRTTSRSSWTATAVGRTGADSRASKGTGPARRCFSTSSRGRSRRV
jgi:DNA repair protein RecO (recombination protein O)